MLKKRGICKLSEIAETFSIVYVKVFRLFIYLTVYENTGAVDELPSSMNSTREKVSSEWRLFSKMDL